MLLYSEMRIDPKYFNYFIIFLVIFLCILYLVFFYNKSNDFSNTVLFTKIVFYFSIIITFALLFMYEVMTIYITEGSTRAKNESWLFTMINALLLGAFILIAGVFNENNTSLYKYTILFILVYFSISGFGYLGIKIVFGVPISDYLNYDTIHSNSSKMSLFITLNLLLFTLIMFITFIVEQEKKQ